MAEIHMPQARLPNALVSAIDAITCASFIIVHTPCSSLYFPSLAIRDPKLSLIELNESKAQVYVAYTLPPLVGTLQPPAF